ncbi:MAG: hypothetical protein MMC23_001653 [Stictis urceolatum]|nr:hypothetical protein [Stictis urceolata]
MAGNHLKRGLKEGYVRGLEKLWALALRRIPGFEDQLVGMLREAAANGKNNKLVSDWLEPDEERSLLQTWKDSTLLKEFDRVFGFLDKLPDKAAKRSAEGSNTFAHAITGPLASDLTERHDTTQPGQGEELSEIWFDAEHDLRASRLTQPSAGETRDTERLPSNKPQIKLPSAAWDLLELYFSYTHCWFPILEKQNIFQVLYEYNKRDHQASIEERPSGTCALLWALLAYAKTQYADVNGAQPRDMVSKDSELDPEGMYKYSQSMITSDPDDLDISYVQALLLLALTDMQCSKWDRAWLRVGQASRAAVVLNLCRGCEYDGTINVAAHGSRKAHTLYGCFVLDTLISARTNRSPQLRSSDIHGIPPVDESGLEEWEPWKSSTGSTAGSVQGASLSSSTYNQLVEVLRHLNDGTNLHTTDFEGQSARIRFENLKNWGAQQPFMSHMDLSVQGKAHIKYPLLPHQIHLRLFYITTLLHLHMLSDQVSSGDLTPYVVALIGQGCRLIEKHTMFFDFTTLPPAFEYFSHTICNSLEALHEDGVSVAIIRGYLRDMKDTTSNISLQWIGFETIRDRFWALFDKVLDSPEQDSSAAVTDAGDSVESPAALTISGAGDLSTDSPTSASVARIPHIQPSWIAQPTMSVDESMYDQIALPDATNAIDTTIMTDPGTGGASDHDSILQDFGTLDAMTFPSNWEESMSHLGFADGSGEQAFHEFWDNYNNS